MQDWTAAFDQMVAASRDVAKAAAAYYHSLVAEGVPDDHAVQMTGAYVAVVLSLPPSSEE